MWLELNETARFKHNNNLNKWRRHVSPSTERGLVAKIDYNKVKPTQLAMQATISSYVFVYVYRAVGRSPVPY